MQSASLAAPEAVAVDSCPNSARWRRRVSRDAGMGLVVTWECEQVGRVWSLKRSSLFCQVSVGVKSQLMPYAEGDVVQALSWSWRWLENHGAPARPEGWAS